MFEDRVEAVVEELAGIVAGLHPDAVPLADAAGCWAVFDRLERLAGAAKVLLARRVDESGVWRTAGFADAASFLAAQAGTAVGTARAVVAASRQLRGLPACEDALRAGRVSVAQAAVIADAATANPAAERRLVETAGTASLLELREACLRAKVAADRDREATAARIRAGRFLRTFTDGEGAWNLVARGPVEVGARIEAALAPLIDEGFTRARAAGRREAREAYAFDALDTLTTQGGSPDAGSRGRPNLRHLALVRVDLAALVRGGVQDGELCEITGVGPIPVSVARNLLGESILELVVTRGVDVANVTHLGRGPSAAQQIAVLWTSPVCTVEGCSRRRTEYDHRTPWAQTHHTRLDDLDPLCRHHHDRKIYDGWALVDGTGKRPMVPPDHPQHPDRRRAPPGTVTSAGRRDAGP